MSDDNYPTARVKMERCVPHIHNYTITAMASRIELD